MTPGQRAARAWRRRRQRAEDGYAAVITAAVLASGVFFGLAAFSVDVSQWYNRMEAVQRAADAAALAGVPYLPQDLPSATNRAREVATRNGFTNGVNGTTVRVVRGDLPSQLEVTITTSVTNSWGSLIGVESTDVSRSAVADYQGPAPMGSPCNTFGNEPPGGQGSTPNPKGDSRSPTATSSSVLGSYTDNCARYPGMWATIEGPETGKVQGDRYQTKGCEDSGVDGCSVLRSNEEYDEFGYVFVVDVRPSAVGRAMTLQLFDPTFMEAGQRCERLPATGLFPNNATMLNPYVTNRDARHRYARDGANSPQFCTGDAYAGASPKTVPVTSFVLREQVDSQNPMEAPAISGCNKQYTGRNLTSSLYASTSPSNPEYQKIKADFFKEGTSAYDSALMPSFHNWVDFCTFTPTRAGHYYLQVRTNVSRGGTCSTYVCTGNPAATAQSGNTTTGGGTNSFAMRAVTTTPDAVSVSGYNHMPIYINADAATSRFNLIRVLPGAAGQFISFSYFDAGDAQGSGHVKVLTPSDATGSITSVPFPSSCRSYGGSATGTVDSPTTLSNCTAPIARKDSSTSKNNGKVQTIDIPVPNDYSCDYLSPDGCWYQVEVNFGSGSVTDVTTWDATVVGDPLRLVE